MKHRIDIRRGRRGLAGKDYNVVIKKCVDAVLMAEGIDKPCYVSVLITDDNGIWKINREFRNVDRPTDVLSFPTQVLIPGHFDPNMTDVDPDSGLLPLGDMVVSVERIRAQAKEYGHSERHELAYLTIHSVLHLLGYDHMDEGEQKKQMRKREKIILAESGFNEE